MTGLLTYDVPLVALLALAPILFVVLHFVAAPYGRHARSGWGPSVSARTAWLVMESPALLVFVGCYATGAHPLERVRLVLCALWLSHYLHRSLVYPLRMRLSAERRTPIAIVAMAFTFNTVNGYVNAAWIASFGDYPTAWLWSAPFVAGVLLFALGYGTNRWADGVLRRLRQPGDERHEIPRGGLYELISCPNYLGELVEWVGWALATYSLAGLSFALFTAANLLPRALANHRWYRERFPDYPPRRRALVPYLL